jgi:hypothetical protein
MNCWLSLNCERNMSNRKKKKNFFRKKEKKFFYHNHRGMIPFWGWDPYRTNPGLLTMPITFQFIMSACLILTLILAIVNLEWLLVIFLLIGWIAGNILNVKLYFFIGWTWAKYKKNIFYFWKLTRLLSHVAFLGLWIQWTAFLIGILLGSGDSWINVFVDPAFFLWLPFFLGFSIYNICGIVINYKKVKKLNLWYRLTSTKSTWVRKYRPLGWI